MRVHIRKYHLRETKLYCPWQICSDFLQGVLKRLPQSVWGGDTVLLVHVVIVELDIQLRYALGFLWSLLTTIFAIHPLDWIMSSP